MAHMDMYNQISSAIDDGDYAVGVFIDLSKAFDTLNYEISLAKQHFYGMRDMALNWFKSYLQNRKQYVYFNGASSALCPITCGVPQGSVLGPLLYILYVNDVTSCSDILWFMLFAEDSNLFYRNNTLMVLEKIMNNEL